MLIEYIDPSEIVVLALRQHMTKVYTEEKDFMNAIEWKHWIFLIKSTKYSVSMIKIFISIHLYVALNHNEKILSIASKNLFDRHLKKIVYLMPMNNIFGMKHELKTGESGWSLQHLFALFSVLSM